MNNVDLLTADAAVTFFICAELRPRDPESVGNNLFRISRIKRIFTLYPQCGEIDGTENHQSSPLSVHAGELPPTLKSHNHEPRVGNIPIYAKYIYIYIRKS